MRPIDRAFVEGMVKIFLASLLLTFGSHCLLSGVLWPMVMIRLRFPPGSSDRIILSDIALASDLHFTVQYYVC